MQITVNESRYELDVTNALAKGVLKKLPKFQIGDVFETNDNLRILIVGGFFHNAEGNVYHIAGYHGLTPWSDFGPSATYEQIDTFIKERKAKFIRNINEEVHKIINV